MTEVEIEYCVPCGNLPEAQDVQETILDELGEDVDRVALKTGNGGVFKVRIDDELFFDRDQADDRFDVEDVIDEVQSRTVA